MKKTTLTLSLLLLSGCARPATRPTQPEEFALTAEPVEVLEGGPLILKVTFTYRGDRPLLAAASHRVILDDLAYPVDVLAPPHWVPAEQPMFRDGTSNGCLWNMPFDINPGESRTYLVPVHHRFKIIPAGRARLRCLWGVQLDGDASWRTATADLDLDVPPATPERLAALRRRLEKELAKPDLPETGQTVDVVANSRQNWLRDRCLADAVIRTQHRALVPLALRMIAASDRFSYPSEVFSFVKERGGSPEELKERLVRMACAAAGPREASRLLWCFGRPGGLDLSPADVKRLMQARSIWTRAMAYAEFSGQCDEASVQALFADLEGLTRPLPPERFARLLADLNHDDYRTREAASGELLALADRAEPQLRQALERGLSPEAARRAQAVLRKLEGGPGLDAASADALARLRNDPRPAAWEVLRALERGRPDARLTREAKAILHGPQPEK